MPRPMEGETASHRAASEKLAERVACSRSGRRVAYLRVLVSVQGGALHLQKAAVHEQ